jgi:hypothetical protein
MKGRSKFEIRNSKQESGAKFDFGIACFASNLLRISNFEFRILALAIVCFGIPALGATNISADDDLQKLRPPRAEIPPTFWEKYTLWVILGSIVVFALIGLIMWIATRPKPPIIVPPEIRAKQALDLLLTKPEDGYVLSQVSQILRHYIAESFALPAGEMTTTEVCQMVGTHAGIGPELAGAISDFLRRCDERKFTLSPPAAPLAAVATAYKLVDAAQARLADLRRRAEQVPAA